jgi:hypothetical protein
MDLTYSLFALIEAGQLTWLHSFIYTHDVNKNTEVHVIVQA